MVLYTPGTTIGASAYEEESLLVRIVGRLTVSTLAANNTPGGYGLGILRTQVNQLTVGSFQDPLVASELALRDWLRVENGQIPPNAGTNGWMKEFELDIRVKRRMKGTDAIYLQAVQATGQNSVVITADIRILIVIRM